MVAKLGPRDECERTDRTLDVLVMINLGVFDELSTSFHAADETGWGHGLRGVGA